MGKFWKEIECDTAETAEIQLASNPSTGYQWVSGTENGLEITDEYIPDEVPEGIVGSGGKQVFRIRAKKPGEYLIEFRYGRSWEPEAIDVKILRIRFV